MPIYKCIDIGNAAISSMQMPSVRKTTRGLYPPNAFPLAYQAVVDGQSVRSAARAQGVSECTLRRYIKKKALTPDAPQPGYQSPNVVFSREQEAVLTQYLLKASDIYYGLSPREVRLNDGDRVYVPSALCSLTA